MTVIRGSFGDLPRATKGQFVYVDWLDAETGSGWDTATTAAKMRPSPVRSFGYVVAVDAARIVLVADVDPSPKKPFKGCINRPIVIPMGMVTAVVRVHLPKG